MDSNNQCLTLVLQAIADATHQPEGHTDRLGLLLRENSLLSKQNAQLDKEVARLQAENDSFSQRCLEASDTAHTASARLRAKEAEVDNMASTYDPPLSQKPCSTWSVRAGTAIIVTFDAVSTWFNNA